MMMYKNMIYYLNRSTTYTSNIILSLCQACVARSGSDEDLRRVTQLLALAVSSYKQASKSCKNLSSKPKAKAKAAPSADGQV